MSRLILFFSALALLAGIVHAQSLPDPIVGSSSSYSVSWTTGVEPYEPLENPTIIGSADDGIFSIDLPFSFPAFASWYDSVNVGTNGNLQFETSDTAFGTYDDSIPPSVFVTQYVTPWIAAAFGDLVVNYDSPLQYEVQGGEPTRVVVIRYPNVAFYSDQSSSLTLDVLLYEGTGTIEVRYYEFDLAPTSFLVGVEGAVRGFEQTDDYAYLPYFQPSDTPTLAGTTLEFTLLSLPPLPPSPQEFVYGSNATYQAFRYIGTPPLTDLTDPTIVGSGDDQTFTLYLPFAFFFFGEFYWQLTVSTNGNLQFQTSSPVYYIDHSIPVPGYYAELVSPWLAFFFGDLFVESDSPILTAVEGSSPNRWFVIRFQNVRYFGSDDVSSVDVRLYELAGIFQIYYYSVASSPAGTLVGIQGPPQADGEYTDWVYLNWLDGNEAVDVLNGVQIFLAPTTPFPTPPSSSTGGNVPQTLTPVYGPSASYATSVAPISGDRPTFDNPTTIGWGDDLTFSVSLPFYFSFFGNGYQELTLSTNGNLQFGTSTTLYSFSSESIPPPSTEASAFVPWIAYYFTDLVVPESSPVTAQQIGDAGTSLFIIRVDAYHFNSPTSAVSIDIVLSEETSGITINYYTVASTPASVLLGISSVELVDDEYVNYIYYEYLSNAGIELLASNSITFAENRALRSDGTVAAAFQSGASTAESSVAGAVVAIVAALVVAAGAAFYVYRSRTAKATALSQTRVAIEPASSIELQA